MNRTLKVFWEKHETWVAPIAMAAFLYAGIQIGIPLGITQGQAASAKQVEDLNTTIKAKDARYRELLASQDNNGDKLVDAATKAAEAAKQSANAANESAAAAKDTARKVSPDAPTPFK